MRLKPSRKRADLLNQSPENPDQLFCSSRAGAELSFRPFSSRQGFHVTENSGEIRRGHLSTFATTGNEAVSSVACRALWQAGDGVAGIAVAQHRFYDLPGFNATPIQTSAKSCAETGEVVRGSLKKDLVNLIPIPIVNPRSGLSGPEKAGAGKLECA
ncbi:MAG: hypothetical protein WBA88_09715 [Pseudaminobacter sp.]